LKTIGLLAKRQPSAAFYRGGSNGARQSVTHQGERSALCPPNRPSVRGQSCALSELDFRRCRLNC
jgi:hypothetical protein